MLRTTPHTSEESRNPFFSYNESITNTKPHPFFPFLWRLFRMEWYRLTRRKWPLLLFGIIMLALVGVNVGMSARNALAVAQRSPDHFFTPPICRYASVEGCTDRELTTEEIERMLKVQQEQVKQQVQSLQLPYALNLGSLQVRFAGILLLVIVVAFLMGDDYGSSTIRLLFTRGATRTQILLAKLATIITIAAGIVITITILTIVIGWLLMLWLFPGFLENTSFITTTWIFQALLYLLTTMALLLTYALICCCATIIGQSTAAGVATGLGWWILNAVIDLIDKQISARQDSGGILKYLTDYSIEKNIGLIFQRQESVLLDIVPPQGSIGRSLVVLGVYLLVPTIIAWLIYTRRDVTS